MYIHIERKDNGFLVVVRNSAKEDCDKIYKATESIELITFLGTLIHEKKVKVEAL